MPRSKSYELSVVVPVGNLNGNITELESWIENNSKLQIIIVLDNSDPETKTAIYESTKINSNKYLEIFEVKFDNPGESRNFGMQHAQGEWICFVDADDFLNLDNVRNVLASPIINGKNVLIGNYEIKNLETEAVSQVKYLDVDILISKLPSAVGLWRFVFRVDYLASMNVKFPSLSMAEDQIFYLRCKPKREEIAFTEKFLYRYSRGGENQLTQNPSKIKDLQNAIPITISLLSQTKLEAFDFLPAQIFAYLTNKSDSSLFLKSRFMLRTMRQIWNEFGLSGILRIFTYPVRRLH